MLQRWVRSWWTVPSGQDWVLESEWARVQQTPVRARVLLYCMIAAIVLFLVWAYFSPIDEVARGEGKVVPSRQLQVLQSFDGGIVQSINVSEGDTVDVGQILLKVDPTRFISDLKENQTQYLALATKAQRLRALTRNTPLSFSEELLDSAPSIVENEQSLYDSNIRELEEQLASSKNRIDQIKQDMSSTDAEISQYQTTLALTQKEYDVTKPLLKSGAVSDIDILRLERQIVELEGSISRAQSALVRQRSAIDEEQSKQQETRLRMFNNWNKELTETLTKMATLEQSKTSLVDVVAQSEIRSPLKGTVQRLFFNTVGGVITPGSPVAEIVPDDDKLIVEAKIAPSDIAFIKRGQKAILKFSAYDFAIYGGIDALVDHISADTITDEKDQTFYIVRLHTTESNQESMFKIIPGMTVQVDIMTGKKTILNYILNPLYKVTSSALKER